MGAAVIPPILEEHVAVVTGSCRGIGAGIARVLAGAGASVVVTDRDADRASDFARDLVDEGHRSLGIQLDVTDRGAGGRLLTRTVEHFGHIDLLVNNAGISGRVPLDHMDDAAWDSMIAVNLTGVQRMARAFIPHFKSRGQGSIINISSVAGRSGKANMSHYSATKFGLIGFSQSLALELAPFNIRVNCVCPGIVRTGPWEVELAEIAHARGITIDEAWQLTLASVPLGRPQEATDIGLAVAFLGSPLATNITGQALNVDGGYQMS